MRFGLKINWLWKFVFLVTYSGSSVSLKGSECEGNLWNDDAYEDSTLHEAVLRKLEWDYRELPLFVESNEQKNGGEAFSKLSPYTPMEFIKIPGGVGPTRVKNHEIVATDKINEFYLLATSVSQWHMYSVTGLFKPSTDYIVGGPASLVKIGDVKLAPEFPSVEISLEQMQYFCKRLQELIHQKDPVSHDLLTGEIPEPPVRVRLPYHYEWMYVSKCCNPNGMHAFGFEIEKSVLYQWNDRNSGGKLHPIAQRTPLNPFTKPLYDFGGNVSEVVISRHPRWYIRALSHMVNDRGPIGHVLKELFNMSIVRDGVPLMVGSNFNVSPYYSGIGSYGSFLRPIPQAGFRVVIEKDDSEQD